MATPAVLWSNERYEIRPAKNNDEYRDVWWGFMQELGWNRGYYDLDSYMNYSNGYGMILLLEKASGKPVGIVCAVINDNSTGWLGMFIISAPHRNFGLGRPLFQAALNDFKRNGVKFIGLDGVVEQRGTYERRNFVVSPVGLVQIMSRPLWMRVTGSAVQPTGGVLVNLNQIPQKLLAQHELKYTGFDRPKLWTKGIMFNRPDARGVAYASSANPTEVDDLFAWTLIRRCSSGVRIGPLYAKDAASARLVLTAAMESATPAYVKETPLPGEVMNGWTEERVCSDASLVTEVWCGNPEAVGLFEELGWSDAGVQYYRMWVDGTSPAEQSQGGLGQKGVFAIFDAAVG